MSDERIVGEGHPVTPDGRYFVVRGRLWRMSGPDLRGDDRERLVGELMDARRAVGAAKRTADDEGLANTRASINRIKRALGERGPVWWDDGAADINRTMVRSSPYADWFAALHRS